MAARVSRRLIGVVLAAALAGPVAGPVVAWAQDDDGLPNVFISPAGKPFRAVKGAPYPVVDWFKEADKNADGKLDHAEFIADAEAFFKVLDINHSGLLDPYDVAVYERRVAPARLWLAQYEDVPVTEGSGDDSSPQKPRTLDETMQGASPYSLLAIPEPVTAGGFDARGVITRAAYMAQAERNFRALDEDEKGYLTLADLPLTKIQVMMGARKGRRGRR
jgi:hypothetical protein